MTVERERIKAEHTYRGLGGRLYYVHALNGQKVTFCEVGSVDRQEASLGRFCSRIVAEVENQ